MTNWLQKLFGAKPSTSDAGEPATAPEPPSMPSDPPAESGMGDEGTAESSGDDSA